MYSLCVRVCVYVEALFAMWWGWETEFGGWLCRPSDCRQEVLMNYIFIDCAEALGPSHTQPFLPEK